MTQEAGDLKLETGGWRRGAVAQEAGDLRLETEDWRREAGSGKLEAWRCVCFDEAGDWGLEAGDWALLPNSTVALLRSGAVSEAGGVASLCRLLETVALLRRKNGWRCGW